MAAHLSVFDFSELLEKNSGNLAKGKVASLFNTFTTHGFVYLRNHGISQEVLDNANDASKDFFSLPLDVKSKYRQQPSVDWHGCMFRGYDSINPTKPGDLRESLMLFYSEHEWPNEVSTFVPALQPLMAQLERISRVLLQAMAEGLKIEDPKFFEREHNIGKPGNSTTLSLNYYPPLGEDSGQYQLRCEEHVDPDTLILLLQDCLGGLQAEDSNGEWFDLPPIPDTLLLFSGRLMQRWTADRIKAINHRVIMPEKEAEKRQSRWSMNYFLEPDDDFVVKCLDGSNKYKPIRTIDHYMSFFTEDYM